jgi:DNA-binding XRE family transcriptional regulator
MFGNRFATGLILGNFIFTIMKQPALGTTLSTLRNQKGMTQQELADACNMDIRSIQRIEAGEVTPRMHTIRLLSNALGCDPGIFINTPSAKTNGNKTFTSDLTWPFFAGVVFSINAIPVVFDLITHSFNTYLQVCTLLIHAISCIFFFKGFYLIGKQYNNQLMAISSLLAMILLPLVNIFYLLSPYYLVASYMFFTLLCINEIIGGIGFLTEGYKRRSLHGINLYTIAGVVIIIQTMLLLSLDTNIMATGLVISLLNNVITTSILYREYKGGRRSEIPNGVQPA